ncbi:hypothetical protein CL622_07155 [archaeon]|nr:hypothetical protein [archaeon]
MSIKEIFNPIAREQKAEIDAEVRQQQFIKEGQVFEAGMREDMEFHYQQEQRNGLVQWQQNLISEVDQLVHDLKSEVDIDGVWTKQKYLVGYDKDGKDVIEEIPPIMNDLGIHKIKSYLRPLISRNLINSNYSDDRIYINLRGLINTIILHLRDNYFYYEIRKQDLSWLIRQIKNMAEPSFWRCYNNGERKYLTTIHKHIEATNFTPNQPQKKGFFTEVNK